jgi:ankyrin repeat protein
MAENEIRLDTLRKGVHQTVAQLRAEWEDTAQAPLTLPDDDDSSDIIRACQLGDFNALKTLIAQGADFHENDDNPMRRAAENGHTQIVNYLLDLGADIHILNDDALQWAAGNGRTETVRLLLNCGANIHTDDDYPLQVAAKGGHIGTVHLLIERGAPLEKLTDDQRQAYEEYQAKQQAVTKTLTGIFNAATWTGHVPEMLELWNMIPEPLQTNFDFQSVLAQTRRQALKSSKPKIILIK